MFHKKYHTWFRKVESTDIIPKVSAITFINLLQGSIGKYIYFDYETTWSEKMS